jgi:hypothetical protein
LNAEKVSMASCNSRNIIEGEKAFIVKNFEDLRQEICRVQGAYLCVFGPLPWHLAFG